MRAFYTIAILFFMLVLGFEAQPMAQQPPQQELSDYQRVMKAVSTPANGNSDTPDASGIDANGNSTAQPTGAPATPISVYGSQGFRQNIGSSSLPAGNSFNTRSPTLTSTGH